MNPISQPSFTRRPIHQSLLNFCRSEEIGWRENIKDARRPLEYLTLEQPETAVSHHLKEDLVQELRSFEKVHADEHI